MSKAPSSCPSGKEWSLGSKQLAINTAILLTMRNGHQMYPYPCQYDECSDWHVTRSDSVLYYLDEKDRAALGVE